MRVTIAAAFIKSARTGAAFGERAFPTLSPRKLKIEDRGSLRCARTTPAIFNLPPSLPRFATRQAVRRGLTAALI